MTGHRRTARIDINKVLEIAHEIVTRADKTEERSKQWQQLAKDARSGKYTKEEIQRRKAALDVTVVTDFGTPIDQLRAALGRKKP